MRPLARGLAAVLIALVVPAVTVAASSAAEAPDKTPPVVKITGLPATGSCASKTTKLKFSIHDASGLRRVYVFIDGDTAGSSVGNAALKVTFPDALHAGRHRLGVLARDNAGNLARHVVHFRVCSSTSS